ncbi:hypothetical protein OAB00_01385 [Akkermansiaceae bacterium]|nr:hypothetical protein [Akkermansiaceae bacterium]
MFQHFIARNVGIKHSKKIQRITDYRVGATGLEKMLGKLQHSKGTDFSINYAKSIMIEYIDFDLLEDKSIKYGKRNQCIPQTMIESMLYHKKDS